MCNEMTYAESLHPLKDDLYRALCDTKYWEKSVFYWVERFFFWVEKNQPLDAAFAYEKAQEAEELMLESAEFIPKKED